MKCNKHLEIEIYNKVFIKIQECGCINSVELIEYIKSISVISDHDINEILELFDYNPNIYKCSSNDLMTTDFHYVGEEFKYVVKNDPEMENRNIERVYAYSLMYIKSYGPISIRDLLDQLARPNVYGYSLLDKDNKIILNVIQKLNEDKNISVKGTLYPIDMDSVLSYVESLPSLEEFEKDNGVAMNIVKYSYSEPKYVCPKCGNNVRKLLNKVLTSNPPKYQYECDSCNYIAYHEH